MDNVDSEGGDKTSPKLSPKPSPEYLTIDEFIKFVQKFQVVKQELESKIDALTERTEYLEMKNKELIDNYSLDVVQKSRGNNKSRVHALRDYIQKNTNITCINTEQTVHLLGADIRNLSDPRKIARRVMIDLAKIYPEIEYFGGEKDKNNIQSHIKIDRGFNE